MPKCETGGQSVHTKPLTNFCSIFRFSIKEQTDEYGSIARTNSPLVHSFTCFYGYAIRITYTELSVVDGSGFLPISVFQLIWQYAFLLTATHTAHTYSAHRRICVNRTNMPHTYEEKICPHAAIMHLCSWEILRRIIEVMFRSLTSSWRREYLGWNWFKLNVLLCVILC